MTVSEELALIEEMLENSDLEVVTIYLNEENNEQLKKEMSEQSGVPIETSITALNGIKVVVDNSFVPEDRAYLIAVKPKSVEENEN